MSYRHPSGEDFGGRIGRTVGESEPWWPDTGIPRGKPNVVLIVLDDTGYSPTSAVTAPRIATPVVDRLAATGAAATRGFHTTALCSPTRASPAHRVASITRCRHASASRTWTAASRTCADSRCPARQRPSRTILREARLLHVRRPESGTWRRWRSAQQPGPFDSWPLQRGFDRYYGFLQGETDQFHPELTRDNHLRRSSGDLSDDGYHVLRGHRRSIDRVHSRPGIAGGGAARSSFISRSEPRTRRTRPRRSVSSRSIGGSFDAGWDVAA